MRAARDLLRNRPSTREVFHFAWDTPLGKIALNGNENDTYPPDEIAVRFSHRLVAIHPFPNGNGRFSRLVGDLLAGHLGKPPFTWGRKNLIDAGQTRARYVEALRGADNHDIGPLLLFARS